MASSFDRWEKDPFFSAAEEVQESANRMESAYRTWMHSKKQESSMWNSDELRRDLRTALGTTKWQLDEFQRAVSSSYIKSSTEDARDRHRDFIIAIEDQILKIEYSLQECSLPEGNSPLPWVRLDEGECNELALFLSGSSEFGDSTNLIKHSRDDKKQQGMNNEMTADCLKSSDHVVEKPHGHRRTASASADIGAWKIAIAEVNCPLDGCNVQPLQPPRKVPSFSGFLSSMEYAPKFKWPKNGVRKWKAMDVNQDSDAAPLRSSQMTKGIHACYEKSKSCLDGCDECYDKQLYGWYGVTQRLLQRSQYQMQYGRPVQVVIWTVLLLCLIVLFVLRAL
ncbi:uncharacterized protein LOC8288516 [Ricinus communis]|uniref:uncharacterized protein LOC8288516 n=1 Tax=Ricinus communis TaxID=3988 RepID=UPI000772C501|nr:uncharacterized protein LOC8288516 [Ricinus communis]|eukprot:XP_015574551.1 uncharacterized protein LOC8288516 [Ricinus communis]